MIQYSNSIDASQATKSEFLSKLEEGSLYNLTRALDDNPHFRALNEDPAVQAKAVAVIMKEISQGNYYDPTRFVKDFGVDRAMLEAAGAPQVCLEHARRLPLTILVAEYLSTFRPQPEGGFDQEYFNARVVGFCASLPQGGIYKLAEAVELLKFPNELSAYREYIPPAFVELADVAKITTVSALARVLWDSKDLPTWTSLLSDLSAGKNPKDFIRTEDFAQLTSPVICATLRLLDIDIKTFLDRCSGPRSGTWQPSSENILANYGLYSFEAPSNVTSGLAPFAKNKLSQESLALIDILFERHGVDFPSALFPAELPILLKFTERDWEQLRVSTEPLLTLHGICNHYSVRAEQTEVDLAEVRKISAMKLYHGTSLSGALAIASHGEMLSHREARQMGLLPPEAGATLESDQQVGLDTKVFLDFGRTSHAQYGVHEVHIVLSAKALNQPGAFVTPYDWADYIAAANSSFAEKTLHLNAEELQRVLTRQAIEYLKDVSIAPYCYEAIARHFKANNVPVDKFIEGRGDRGSFSVFEGGREAMGFQPPEVKLPRGSGEFIEAFEFRKGEDLISFVEAYPHYREICRLMPTPRGKFLPVEDLK